MGQFKIRNVAISYTAGFTLGFCMFGALSYLPVYFQVVQGDSATNSGLRLLAIIIPNVIVMIGSGIVVSKIGWITPMPVAGLAILCMGMGILSLLDINSTFAAAPAFWTAFQVLLKSQEFAKYESREYAKCRNSPSFLRSLPLARFIFATESYGGHYGPEFVTFFDEQNAKIDEFLKHF